MKAAAPGFRGGGLLLLPRAAATQLLPLPPGARGPSQTIAADVWKPFSWLPTVAAALLLASHADGQRAPVWPDALLTHTLALALIQGLNAEIAVEGKPARAVARAHLARAGLIR